MTRAVPPRKRTSIRQRASRAAIQSIQLWADQADVHFDTGAPMPEIKLVLVDWPFGSPNGDLVALNISDESKPATSFNPALVAFLRMSTMLIGTIGFTSDRAGKPKGEGRFYPQLRLSHASIDGRWVKRNLSIYRISTGAVAGDIVHEVLEHHQRGFLQLNKGSASEGTAKFQMDRTDAIGAALDIYDYKLRNGEHPYLQRAVFEKLLWRLLVLNDQLTAVLRLVA